MKCEIKCDGVMEFRPENHSEAYALDCWLEDNVYRLIDEVTHPSIEVVYRREDLEERGL